MTIYEIDKEIFSMIDQETGEILDYERLCLLNIDRYKKIENIAALIKNFSFLGESIKKEIDNLSKRNKTIESNIEKLKGLLYYVLDGNNFESAKCKVTFRQTPERVDVEDESNLINWLQRENKSLIIPKYELDKKAIKNYIKDGHILPYCSIKQDRKIYIR